MSNYVPGFPTSATPIPQFNQFLQNWQALNTVFGTDHTQITEPDANKRGHHKFVQFYDVQPDPTLAKPFSQLYTKNQAVPGDVYRALFFAQKPDTAPQIVKQLTDLNYSVGVSVNAGTTLNYRVYDTPWGWRIHLGNTNAFSGSRTFSGISPNFLGSILFQSTSGFGGGPVSTATTANPGLAEVNMQTSASIPTTLIVISTAQ